MSLTSLILLTYLFIGLVKLIKAGIRKIYNPVLTESAKPEYISTCVKTKSFTEFKTGGEELFEFEGIALFAHYTAHEVPGILGGILVEFDVHPNAGKKLSISCSTFVFIRSDDHIEWMREKLETFETARNEFTKAINGGFSPLEERAIVSKIAEICGRPSEVRDLETSLT